tara:strand:+ start:1261 stop:1926 length:666 start_codon:yes stop_codon:yes gene_type:complete
MKNVKQLLPKGSKELIKKALTLYKNSIEIINRDGKGEMIDDSLNYDHFDCIGLIGMMNYDVEVILPKESKECFSGKHNVDFPIFEEVERMYPIESEWVTIIKGDFSFVHDGVHGRECYVNSIVSVTRHLRCDKASRLTLGDDGWGWIVVEDYDGIIHMNVEDKKEDEKEFLVIDSMVDSVRRQTYTEMKETDGDIMDRIDTLEVGDTGARNDCEVYYIRVK